MIEKKNELYLSRANFIKCKEGDIHTFYDIAKKVSMKGVRNLDEVPMASFTKQS